MSCIISYSENFSLKLYIALDSQIGQLGRIYMYYGVRFTESFELHQSAEFKLLLKRCTNFGLIDSRLTYYILLCIKHLNYIFLCKEVHVVPVNWARHLARHINKTYRSWCGSPNRSWLIMINIFSLLQIYLAMYAHHFRVVLSLRSITAEFVFLYICYCLYILFVFCILLNFNLSTKDTFIMIL